MTMSTMNCRIEVSPGEHVEAEARLIGAGSSKRVSHLNHLPHEFGARFSGCSGCRWSETRIWITPESRYIVQTVGRSIVPGETDHIRTIWEIEDPDEVVEVMLVTPRNDRGGDLDLPGPSLWAIEQAGENHPELMSALRKWEQEAA